MSNQKDFNNSGIELVTKDEMEGFVQGLFDEKVPSINPDWQINFPDLDTIQKETTVELASVTEVREFISDLFKKS